MQSPDSASGRPRDPLVQGVDYYIENGFWVFTAAYHLKRGHCCNSGCRHCPWRDQSKVESES